MIRLTFLFSLLYVDAALGFVPAPALRACRQARQATATCGSRSTQMVAQMEQTGLHGTGSRFLPIVQIGAREHYPRTVCIAGAYPGLTAEDIAAPTSGEPAEQGTWQYDFTDPEGPQMGTVALPGGDTVTDLIDPVIIVAASDSLGISLPQDATTEVLAVVDRAEVDFQEGKFFVWQAPDKSVIIRWFKQEPQGYQCLGRVVFVHVPFLDVMKKPSSGFEEEMDDF
ncbi:hypothetical protein JKP88DRAFT_225645 [Tribonema minus]|uniref:Rubisco accumulation factor 1 C-terminal domain-containing protein n=1 Tax=Tribonema minus TaxID=303371 RepID=A0A836C9L5_9STRA|nr:hypothetical protein JKP88DRAFT_225645 [Tribonema minus]